MLSKVFERLLGERDARLHELTGASQLKAYEAERFRKQLCGDRSERVATEAGGERVFTCECMRFHPRRRSVMLTNAMRTQVSLLAIVRSYSLDN